MLLWRQGKGDYLTSRNVSESARGLYSSLYLPTSFIIHVCVCDQLLEINRDTVIYFLILLQAGTRQYCVVLHHLAHYFTYHIRGFSASNNRRFITHTLFITHTIRPLLLYGGPEKRYSKKHRADKAVRQASWRKIIHAGVAEAYTTQPNSKASSRVLYNIFESTCGG